jgi:CopG family transcriptional regulator, nickel-responsive regulator
MSDLVRTSFSIERPLLARLEQMAAQSRYTNRSEFLRDMIRQHLVEQEWQANEVAVGTITLVYDHHSRLLMEKLTDEQHRHHDVILATTHVHLDEHMCVEMILTRGPAKQLRELASLLRKQKGVLHAAMSMGSTGKKLV